MTLYEPIFVYRIPFLYYFVNENIGKSDIKRGNFC